MQQIDLMCSELCADALLRPLLAAFQIGQNISGAPYWNTLCECSSNFMSKLAWFGELTSSRWGIILRSTVQTSDISWFSLPLLPPLLLQNGRTRRLETSDVVSVGPAYSSPSSPNIYPNKHLNFSKTLMKLRKRFLKKLTCKWAVRNVSHFFGCNVLNTLVAG